MLTACKFFWNIVYIVLLGIILGSIFAIVSVNAFVEAFVCFITTSYIFFHEKYFLDPISELSCKLLKKIF